METLETIIKIGSETIEIWRWGLNDYSVNFINGDCSVRGTLADIVIEIEEFINNIKWLKLSEKIKDIKCDIKETV